MPLPYSLGDQPWWRSAAIYQVYIRSFSDSNGDGIGDINGIRDRLSYLRELGVDAIWITPWYRSPMADGGYDVMNYQDIDPTFGTITDAEALVREAHDHGLRVIVDIVPNHTSTSHPWFQSALSAEPDSPERSRYLFRDGLGRGGNLPPNNWRSLFGGPAWTRVTEPDGRPGQWYLHLFAPEQADLNWGNSWVCREFESILRFWFDRGIDGFRVDAAHRLVKHPALPNLDSSEVGHVVPNNTADHPYVDREAIHTIYRRWRHIAESYAEPRIFVAEAWLPSQEKLARYVRSDELHTAFNFQFLCTHWDASALRETIEETLNALRLVDAPATWVLSNHDVVRHVSRFGRPIQERARTLEHVQLSHLQQWPLDLELGTRRARAAALLSLALPGNVYIYQGDELGLWEVEDLPDQVLQDPRWEGSGHRDRGRDGCRIPLPWTSDALAFGFSPNHTNTAPWLPQPPDWHRLAADAQLTDPDSILQLYRSALRIRHGHPGLGDGPIKWLDAPTGMLLFARGADFICAVNVSAEPWQLPANSEIILASGSQMNHQLSSNTAVWLTTG